jgi:hypothetical protein
MGNLGHPAALLTSPTARFWLIGLLTLGFGTALIAFLLSKRQVSSNFEMSGINGVVGRFGGGKTYFLTHLALIALKKGRLVFSNYPIGDVASVQEFSEYVNRVGRIDQLDRHGRVRGWRPGTHDLTTGEPVTWTRTIEYEIWDEILDVPIDSFVIMDEAHIWWPSSSSGAPVEVKQWITQLRHRGILALWASQDVEFVARWLRKLSFGVWECSRIKNGHMMVFYEPRMAESSRVQRPSMARIFLVRKKEVMNAYDTLATVNSGVEWGALDNNNGQRATVNENYQPRSNR